MTRTNNLVLAARLSIIVTTGLDPVVHADETTEADNGESQKRHLCVDCRVKPGNDDARDHSRDAFSPELWQRHCKKLPSK